MLLDLLAELDIFLSDFLLFVFAFTHVVLYLLTVSEQRGDIFILGAEVLEDKFKYGLKALRGVLHGENGVQVEWTHDLFERGAASGTLVCHGDDHGDLH